MVQPQTANNTTFPRAYEWILTTILLLTLSFQLQLRRHQGVGRIFSIQTIPINMTIFKSNERHVIRHYAAENRWPSPRET